MARGLDAGRERGGILKLRELAEQHPAELAHDFRARFNLSALEIGHSVTWLEAVYLVAICMRDTSSWLCAAYNGWKYPVSREWIVASHTYDLHARVNSKTKPKPYPNPFPSNDVVKTGKTDKTFAEVRAILDRMNPKEDPNG